MSDFLKKIKQEKLDCVAKQYIPVANFMDIFEGDKPAMISEIKNASPSLGKIANHDALSVARGYVKNGASALSVLTEDKYFAGSKDYITKIRKEMPSVPILQKDFFTSLEQICESKLYGASAILLIVAMLDKKQLRDFFQLSKALGLTALVETHNESEVETALKIGANLIGVNNRNLKSLKVDLDVSRSLSHYTGDAVFVSESGIKTSDEMLELYELGYQGFLIGTSFMKTENPAKALAKFVGREFVS